MIWKKTKIVLSFIFPSKTNVLPYHLTYVGVHVRHLSSEQCHCWHDYYIFLFYFLIYFKDLKKIKNKKSMSHPQEPWDGSAPLRAKTLFLFFFILFFFHFCPWSHDGGSATPISAGLRMVRQMGIVSAIIILII